jgi:hypothetical protein
LKARHLVGMQLLDLAHVHPDGIDNILNEEIIIRLEVEFCTHQSSIDNIYLIVSTVVLIVQRTYLC